MSVGEWELSQSDEVMSVREWELSQSDEVWVVWGELG